jgi:hypothetical protein
MKHMIRLFVSLLVPAFMLAGVAASPAMAQDKAKDAKAAMAEKGKAVIKVLHEDDRVRVTEATFKPGDIGPNIVRGFRVTRPLKNGTLERTYADGKKEKVERKAGEVIVAGPDKQAFVTKNVGKSAYSSYTVTVKEAKK